MMIPAKDEPGPRVALLPTCQKTLAAVAPLIRTTWLPVVVIRVEPIWKIKMGFEAFRPSKVTGPVIASELGSVYRPGASVCPPIS